MRTKQYTMTRIAYQKALEAGIKFRGATIHETMGPNFKDIYYMNNRPFVVDSKHSRTEVLDVISLFK